MHVVNSALFVGPSALEQLSLTELSLKVIEERCRPKISDKVNQGLAALIKDCWAQEPEQRPQYTEIVDRLDSIDADF